LVRLRDEYSQVLKDIRSLSKTPRPAGSHASVRIERVIRSRLESPEKFALRIQTFEFKQYVPRKYLLQVDGERRICLPLLCSKATPRTGITAPLARYTAHNQQGKIALIPVGKVHESFAVEDAASRGAVAAIVFPFSGPLLSGRAAYPRSSISCVSVSSRLGWNLWGQLSERKFDARVLVEAKIVRGRATNIIATPRSLPTKTLLVAHRDSRIFSPGAIDNASGCALLLLSARQRGRPDYGILLTDAEEYGLQGAKHFVKSEQLDKSTEVVNFDSVGAGKLGVVTKSRSGKMPRTQITKIRRLASRINLDLASISTPRGSDSDVFIERGFHACWVRSYPTPSATTVEDTIEYVDPATIGKSVRLMKALVA